MSGVASCHLSRPESAVVVTGLPLVCDARVSANQIPRAKHGMTGPASTQALEVTTALGIGNGLNFLKNTLAANAAGSVPRSLITSFRTKAIQLCLQIRVIGNLYAHPAIPAPSNETSGALT